MSKPATKRSARLKKIGLTRPANKKAISRRRLRRRLSGGLLLLIALTIAGGLAAVLTPRRRSLSPTSQTRR